MKEVKEKQLLGKGRLRGTSLERPGLIVVVQFDHHDGAAFVKSAIGLNGLKCKLYIEPVTDENAVDI